MYKCFGTDLDPVLGPDPTFFFSGFQYAKNLIFFLMFLYFEFTVLHIYIFTVSTFLHQLSNLKIDENVPTAGKTQKIITKTIFFSFKFKSH